MDSEVQRDGRILDLIDDAWREDKLPYEDVAIPLNELPEPEQDNGGTTESVKEQEMKWTDLALQYLHENVPPVVEEERKRLREEARLRRMTNFPCTHLEKQSEWVWRCIRHSEARSLTPGMPEIPHDVFKPWVHL